MSQSSPSCVVEAREVQGNAIAYNASLSSLETLRGKDGRSVTDPFGGFKGGLEGNV